MASHAVVGSFQGVSSVDGLVHKKANIVGGFSSAVAVIGGVRRKTYDAHEYVYMNFGVEDVGPDFRANEYIYENATSDTPYPTLWHTSASAAARYSVITVYGIGLAVGGFKVFFNAQDGWDGESAIEPEYEIESSYPVPTLASLQAYTESRKIPAPGSTEEPNVQFDKFTIRVPLRPKSPETVQIRVQTDYEPPSG